MDDVCDLCLCSGDDENPVVLDGTEFHCLECIKDLERMRNENSD